jgi:hypothetical protein
MAPLVAWPLTREFHITAETPPDRSRRHEEADPGKQVKNPPPYVGGYETCVNLQRWPLRRALQREEGFDHGEASWELFTYASRETARTALWEGVIVWVLIGCSWLLMLVALFGR